MISGGFILFVVLLMQVIPVSGYNSAEVNDTALAVWDSSDSGAVCVFNPVVFWANLTNSTTGEQIADSMCMIRYSYGGRWSDPRQMPFSDDGAYVYSKSFVMPGTYLFEVDCGNVSAQDEWVYTDYPDRICSVDAYFTKDGNGFPVANFRNTGNWYEQVSYVITIKGNTPIRGERILEAGETLPVTIDWPGGTGTIELDASTDCGATDRETMEFGHQDKETYSCKYPFGYEGNNLCDYKNRAVLVCSGGNWITDDSRSYCHDCSDTCGDGVLNCGETLRTCPRDARISGGWLDEYQCSGDTLQRKRLSYAYGYEWADWKDCEAGCSNGECIKTCGVEIVNFERTSRFTTNQAGLVTVTFRNTGERNENVKIDLYLDGKKKETRYVNNVNPGETESKPVYYYSSRGDHRVSVQVSTDCGKSDSVYSDITVYQHTQAHVDPYGKKDVLQPLETNAWINLNALDMEAGTSRTIPVHFQTDVPQDFEIDVTGIPEDWVSFSTPVSVERKDTAYIYLTGKRQGSWKVNIRITAEKEGLEFAYPVDVYVGPDEVKEPLLFDFSPDFSWLTSVGETQAGVAAMAALAMVALFLGVLRLREPDILEDDE